MTRSSILSAICIAALASVSFAETKVEVKKTHLCCGQCVKVATKVLDDDGVKGTVSQQDSTITFTAPDDKTAQKVLDDLAAAGFHGETGNDKLKMPDNGSVPEGKVTSLTLKGVHNCCGQCNNKIKATVKKIEGVEADTAAPKAESFTVTGNFDAKALVKALNEAGFHATVEKK